MKMDLVMVCHIPPFETANKQKEMPLPFLSPINSLNSTYYKWDGTKDKQWHFPLLPCFIKTLECDRQIPI